VDPQDFPEATPSKEWAKKELLDFITSKGGYADIKMKKDWLLNIALNLV